ncbi:potassium channel family protein [Sabulicella glaciei]|uniref:Potassium channel family protein n=1 Tax=Sabulicella glaciei TaxID=2984948 RepID=A0ABT3NTE8_9PROT|nr:potassium channel family protein [Roseococcus sp. MDT2-1-1]MCW8085428.1 potassium channel family protein [Roseococcus sp. MDT2-1-1]
MPRPMEALVSWLSALAATLAGCVLLLAAAYEVYATVLHARARAGPVAEGLSRTAWRLAMAYSSRLPREGRHRALSRVGPLMLPLLLTTLVGLLTIGFGLIYWPWMPGGFRVDEGAEEAPAFLQAVYFSGITLTTLGYGDIVPRATPMRLVALLQAVTGFVAIPLTVAYFLNVNGVLERRRAAARALFQEAARGPDAAAALLARHHLEGRFVGLDEVLRKAAYNLQAVLESHVEHPVTRYFHPPEVHDGLPRMLFLALETDAVLRAFPDPEHYPEACGHPALTALEDTASQAIRELSATLHVPRTEAAEWTPRDRRRLAQRIARTRARLAEAGIAERPDLEEATRVYLDRRAQWEGPLREVAGRLGYDWDELTGDNDPGAAAEADSLVDEETPAST